MNYTPMLQQYIQIKEKYRDAILFFRLGDFYEMFFDDAILASRLLEITLTAREGGGGKKVAMCGVPHHAAEGYIGRLIACGHRVAVCEQVEDPKTAKSIVQREVVRVFTPGTLFESKLLKEKINNYIAVVARTNEGYGLAIADVSTGQFMITEFSEPQPLERLIDELARINPSEIVISDNTLADTDLNARLKPMALALSTLPDQAFDPPKAWGIVKEIFPAMQSQLDFTAQKMAITAAGALLAFVRETQENGLGNLDPPQLYFCKQYMTLDLFTRRNLELTTSLREGTKKHTLYGMLDFTRTAMGGRLLKNYVEQPLVDMPQIVSRQEAVKELADNPLLLNLITTAMGDIYDLERLAGRVVFGTANARDLIALKKSLRTLPKLKELLSGSLSGALDRIDTDIDRLEDVEALIDGSVAEKPPGDVMSGNIIKNGYNEEVDYLRQIGGDSKSKLAQMESQEKERTGIKSLKIGFNKVFGYYIEVTKSNLAMVPADYQRKQTLVNAERYITEELKHYEQAILGSKERLISLEYELFCQIRGQIAKESKRIKKTAAVLAELDVYLSLATAAVKNNYTCPTINESGLIQIKDGRHPVLEKTMDPGKFVPNDASLDNEENRLLLITGPNMAGKSTYMRQVSLIVLMAQIGSFVPAKSASIGVVDRIFTRVGASDDLAGGDSTFMVEMKECKAIIDHATPNSLIVMDEVGRGTSTYDGMSIARALIEYINTNIRAKTLFSTHYHELTNMDSMDGITNYTVAVREDNENIIFLRKVVPGKANRSYGIHVAKLAGLPEEVLQRSNDILKELESRRNNITVVERKSHSTENYESDNYTRVIEEIKNLDLNGSTPLEALNKLYELQNAIK